MQENIRKSEKNLQFMNTLKFLKKCFDLNNQQHSCQFETEQYFMCSLIILYLYFFNIINRFLQIFVHPCPFPSSGKDTI